MVTAGSTACTVSEPGLARDAAANGVRRLGKGESLRNGAGSFQCCACSARGSGRSFWGPWVRHPAPRSATGEGPDAAPDLSPAVSRRGHRSSPGNECAGGGGMRTPDGGRIPPEPHSERRRTAAARGRRKPQIAAWIVSRYSFHADRQNGSTPDMSVSAISEPRRECPTLSVDRVR